MFARAVLVIAAIVIIALAVKWTHPTSAQRKVAMLAHPSAGFFVINS